jgi:Leucine-rich repeat (LRR) protein
LEISSPYPFDRFSNLKKLRIEKNELKEMPIEICKLLFLEELSLAYNNIKVLVLEKGLTQTKVLPKEIEKLTSLSALFVHNNKLDEFPKGTLLE